MAEMKSLGYFVYVVSVTLYAYKQYITSLASFSKDKVSNNYQGKF